LLAGGSGDSLRKRNNAQAYQKYQPQLEAYSKFCGDAGLHEADAALAWALTNKNLTAPIIGARTLKQFEDSLKVLEIKMDESMAAELDKIFPGPGGASPEAYAW
jgi:aryl-alcohol dehydrogenase-like predicted oxidoreductase